ncbi:MATE family efflux transporter [Siculibacillus lacustris]|uniref:MATE family efflux transporter n=1 Tax=Siculibacillus lacustris TaxID=1549641 RepID=A0A4Q9VYD3_9HYPH|nr:MATE family efflux transporter [Siculibacillus lacustris]TBW40438.1 MATE family efflux transporter [Siculibacillus lacustris]
MPLPARLAPWRAEAVATLALAWPMILGQLAQMALNTTDVLLLSRLSAEAVASGALAVNLYNVFMLFGVGVMSATMPMVARERGRMRHSVRDVRRTVGQSMWAAVALAVPSWAVLWNAEPIFALLGQDPALGHDAARILHVLMWGLLPFFVFIALRAFVAALERPMWVLAIGVAAVPVNAVIGWALIFGRLGAPELGLIGVGWATFLTNAATVAAMAVVLSTDRRFRRYHLFGRFWRADPQRFVAFFKLGAPIGAMIAFETTIFNAAAFLAGLLGTATLAAHAITLQIAGTAFMIPLGLSQAATVRVGLAYGRRDAAGIAVAGWTAMALVVVVMAVTASTMTLAPTALIGAFLDAADPAVAATFALARSFLALAAIFQLADGIQVVTAGMLRGRHDTRVPMILAGIGYWGIGLTASVVLAFPLGFGGRGIWMGLASGLGVVAVALVVRWVRLTAADRAA